MCVYVYAIMYMYIYMYIHLHHQLEGASSSEMVVYPRTPGSLNCGGASIFCGFFRLFLATICLWAIIRTGLWLLDRYGIMALFKLWDPYLWGSLTRH